MELVTKDCPTCDQRVGTDDRGKVGLHAAAGKRCPGQGS
jgi:hypothetical protein